MIISKNTGFSIKGKDIIKDIEISVVRGEFVGIIGPNGSGKSTFLKCLYRVLKPTDGAIFVKDKDVHKMKDREAAKAMAVLAQHNDFTFDFSVIDTVLMGRTPYKKFMENDTKEDYDLSEMALERVGMGEFRDRSMATLSGGEKQRILLARTLVQKGSCIIMDEPTNHLDIKYTIQIMDILKSLDTTVISAIHDLNMAAQYCDRIYALKDGEVVLSGPPKEVFTRENIKFLYEVDSEIYEDGDGEIFIRYTSKHVRKM